MHGWEVQQIDEKTLKVIGCVRSAAGLTLDDVLTIQDGGAVKVQTVCPNGLEVYAPAEYQNVLQYLGYDDAENDDEF